MAWWVAGTDRKRTADERIGEDMAEYAADTEKMPEMLKRIREFGPRREDGLAWPRQAVALRLAPGTRTRVRRFRPGRRARAVNAALGSAIFAAMSVGSLAILGYPYGYIFAAGTAALAVILPVWELRGNV